MFSMKTTTKYLTLLFVVMLLSTQLQSQNLPANPGINQTVPSNPQGVYPNNNIAPSSAYPPPAGNTSFPPNNPAPPPLQGPTPNPNVPNNTNQIVPGYPGTPVPPNATTPNTPAQPGTGQPSPNTGDNNAPPHF
jgi:hypothetical protein